MMSSVSTQCKPRSTCRPWMASAAPCLGLGAHQKLPNDFSNGSAICKMKVALPFHHSLLTDWERRKTKTVHFYSEKTNTTQASWTTTRLASWNKTTLAIDGLPMWHHWTTRSLWLQQFTAPWYTEHTLSWKCYVENWNRLVAMATNGYGFHPWLNDIRSQPVISLQPAARTHTHRCCLHWSSSIEHCDYWNSFIW